MRELSVRATNAFLKDLEAAATYHLENAGPISASRFLDEYDSFRSLVSTFPGHGSPVGDSGLRWRKVGAFVAVYVEDSSSQEVLLLRLYYMTSNWRARTEGDDR